MPTAAGQLRAIKTFEDLVIYLQEELDWPLEEYGFDELTFEYSAAELGLKDDDAAKVKTIHQLRPLSPGQPWGIFFVEFEKKRMPVVVLRRVLSHLVIKKRASANRAQAATWNLDDLIFISAFGAEATDQREIAFAHFHQEEGDLPTLRVLGWDGADTVLKLEYVDATLKDRLRWPRDPGDVDVWRERWSAAFRQRLGHVICTSDALAERLAVLAIGIRTAARTLMEHESENGALRRLHKAFQTALIHDLSEADFADTYAQTVTYGLLTAAISRTEMSEGRYGTALIAANVTDMVPITNPFLREMLETFLQAGGRQGGINFDELGIQDVVELLRGDETDLPAIVRDFGNRTQHEDPVIYFYEYFAKRYDPVEKVRRGEFYTPQPVVSYIVRSVHELLQTEFGLEDGLASTVAWGEMARRHPGLKIPDGTDPQSPFVVILDPATGTATFPVEVIDVIYHTLTAKWTQQRLTKEQQRDAWNEYVPQHLLPRLYGFELKMAPYAIAHMRIGLKLWETGYQFGSVQRVRVYLTNTLEPAAGEGQQLTLAGWAPALAHEAQAVNAIKRQQCFTVVVGNPPYSDSKTENRWIMDKIEVFKAGLQEQKADLNREEWKFLRVVPDFARCNYYINGYIINNAFLKAITHRLLRKYLFENTNLVEILNLHGSSKPVEHVPEPVCLLEGISPKDENVFDIQQGVCIWVSATSDVVPAHRITYRDAWGSRERKYSMLALGQMSPDEQHQQLTPRAPYFFFVPRDESCMDEYQRFVRLTDVMVEGISGIQTGRDDFVSSITPHELEERLSAIRSGASWESIAPGIEQPIWAGFSLAELRQALRRGEEILSTWLCRPFDYRPILYHDSVIKRTRGDLMRSMLERNVALITVRQLGTPQWRHIFVTNTLISDTSISASSREYNYLFPLYRKLNASGFSLGPAADLNLRETFLRTLSDSLSVDQRTLVDDPVSVLNYAYAVFHSPTYRSRYAEFLKIDFPRLPLTSSVELFHMLAQLGGELVALHLMESRALSAPITAFRGRGDGLVAAGYPKFEDGVVLINGGQGFDGVPDDVWEFHIGGYPVCHKWLKDRRGRRLSQEDTDHYCKIVVALAETIRLMGEIDEVIEAHGGWPIR